MQGIPGPVHYIVTLNPPREVAPDKVLYETVYTHPLYTASSVDTHALLPRVQNRRGIAWAGAWCGYGFHEDGLVSALRAVQALDPACLPEWSSVTPAEAGVRRLGSLDPGLRRGDKTPEPAVETP